MRSAKKCKMMMDNMEGKCHEEKSTGDISITKDLPPCCQIKIIDNNITDNFIFSSNDIGTKTQAKFIFISDINIFNPEINLSNHDYTGGSPPLISDNHIYLTNSILLI